MHGVDPHDEIAYWREQFNEHAKVLFEVVSALNAANVPLAYMDTEPLSTAQRIALLIRDRDEARKLAADAQAANSRLIRDNRTLRGEKHPHAPDICPSCSWANIGLMNYGETRASIWLCHGCAAKRVQRLAKYERVVEELKGREWRTASDAAFVNGQLDALDAEDGQ
ncbi:MAG: hypothetical protein AB7E70_19510 [Hyphomicrobiaceae bacterium]